MKYLPLEVPLDHQSGELWYLLVDKCEKQTILLRGCKPGFEEAGEHFLKDMKAAGVNIETVIHR